MISWKCFAPQHNYAMAFNNNGTMVYMIFSKM